MATKTIVLGVTGSIAAYKSAEIIRRLQDEDFRVVVIMTAEAERFITALTLATLSGEKVYRDMFDRREDIWQADHIPLADRADAILISPATANVISKIAGGIADDLLTCTVMTARAPLLIAPAMNERMYQNAIFQDNCRKLKDHGVFFIAPEKGRLACGTVGEGHLAPVETIVAAVKKAVLSKKK